MRPEILLLIFLAIGLAANALVQVVTARRGWLRSFFLGFILGLAAFLVLAIVILPGRVAFWPEGAALTVAGAIAYVACGFFYFSIVNGGRSGLRIRLLAEIAETPEGLTTEDILKRYPSDEMYRARMERMLYHGQVVRREGRLFTGKPTLIILGGLVIFAKWIILGKKWEFD